MEYCVSDVAELPVPLIWQNSQNVDECVGYLA